MSVETKILNIKRINIFRSIQCVQVLKDKIILNPKVASRGTCHTRSLISTLFSYDKLVLEVILFMRLSSGCLDEKNTHLEIVKESGIHIYF